MPLEIFTDESGHPLLTEQGDGVFVGEGWYGPGLLGERRFPPGRGERYAAKGGELLDAIVWRQYGRRDAAVMAAVLAQNPGLADVGPALPAGWIVHLPAVATPAPAVGRIRLWK